ncbi:MAG: NAD(P)H-dependent oxidoreductase subunit E [Opitutaceae bacterium]|nr:NAD(P)H-dependent oxidoreductase subunit E [Opitutaceae bacterium]
MISTATVCANVEPATEAERFARLDQVIAEYRNIPGALIPLLQIAQGLFGYLPETALKHICTGLNKSYSEVAGVVGFYSFFSTTPRGRHTIRVCQGTACYVRGGKRVLETFKHTLGVDVGQTTPSRQFTLEVARCLGACGIAPACLVDNAVHQSIKPNHVPVILQKYE